MSTAMRIALVAGLVAGTPRVPVAQQPAPPARHASYRREVPRRLLARVRISEDSALKIAVVRMPGARVRALELERERGRLIWSWEMKLAGRTGIEEVNVDALDGSIVGVEHEDAPPERRDSAGPAGRRP